MTLNLPEVARAVGAPGQPPPLAVSGWSVDTRTQNRGDVYFALRGPHHALVTSMHRFPNPDIAEHHRAEAVVQLQPDGTRLRPRLFSRAFRHRLPVETHPDE